MSQSANFSFSGLNNSFCSPATIRFSNSTAGNPVGYLWNFGNGQKSNARHPEVIYRNPGVYTVRLIAVYENSTSEVTKQITIKPGSTAEITSDRDRLCAPSAVSFSGNTGSSLTYEWDFGDNSAPQTGSVATISHIYRDFGSFNAILKTTNSAGCSANASRQIQISKPEISASLSTATGCVPVNNQFTASVSNISNAPVSGYLWSFGDGISETTSSPTVSHLYVRTGGFVPTLTITTADGCTNSYIFDSVKYGTPPVNLVAYTTDSIICANRKATFIAHADGADSYVWDFGNGNSLTIPDTIVSHKFTSLGQRTVIVTPMFHDCPGSPDTLTINVRGAIARFAYQNTCDDKKTFEFRNTSSGRNLQLFWSIDETPVNMAAINNRYTFPVRDAIPVQLIALEPISGCADTINKIIFTASPTLVNNSSQICINDRTRFTIQRNYLNTNLSYTWHVLGNQDFLNRNASLDIRAENLGIFNCYVIIQNGISYCPDTIHLNHNITVKGPNIGFEAPNSICLKDSLHILNTSFPFFSSDSILFYKWNMGDNSTLFNSIIPPSYQYKNEGSYKISLTGTDINGCTDSVNRTVMVRPMPFVWIIPKNKKMCQGNSATMIAYTSDNLFWTTTLPQPSLCAQCDTNNIAPLHSSTYIATATNEYNCVSIDSSSVRIIEPFQATSDEPLTFICENLPQQLHVRPNDKIVDWEPATDLNDARIPDPIITPTASRHYKVTLIDSSGCFKSVTEIAVKMNPSPDIELTDIRILPLDSRYTMNPVYSNNTDQFIWSPAGDLSCQYCPNPTTLVDQTKTYSLTAISDSGCVTTDSITLVVECNSAYFMIPSAFTPNNDGLNDVLYPIAKGIPHINRFAVYNRNSNLLFEARNFTPNQRQFGWNGKYKGLEMPQGAYVYVIEATCDLGQTTVKKGSFILIR